MPYLKKAAVLLVAIMLWGCPGEDCDKVMQCEDDVEMFCDKTEAGCGEDCHYYVYEYCYEVCKDED